MKKPETMRSLTLSIKDRVMMGSLYPQQSDLVTQVLVKDIDKKVSVNQQELKRIEFRTDPTGCKWNSKKARDIKVLFSEMELNFLKDQVTRLDKEKRITPDLVDLCLKIKDK